MLDTSPDTRSMKCTAGNRAGETNVADKNEDMSDAGNQTHTTAGAEREIRSDSRQVCGIVMPIAAMEDEYPEAHWTRVRRILQRAIDRAGLRSQLVWENPEVDVIQTAILQNLFENDVVICDVSNLNPNVMLETGIRLSTKRPIIIVTDRVKKPPFDISTIGYIDYQKDLEYDAIEDFIVKLSKRIGEVAKAAAEDKYQSYLGSFRFETVQPTSVTVTPDEYVKERLDEITRSVGRLLRNQRAVTPTMEMPAERSRSDEPWKVIGTIRATLDQGSADILEKSIDSEDHLLSSVSKIEDNLYEFDILVHPAQIANRRDHMRKAQALILEAEELFAFK